MRESGPGEEQRSPGVEPLRVERRHLAARGAVQDHAAARAQRRQAVVEGVLADAVVDDVRAAAAGDLIDDLAEAAVAGDVDQVTGGRGAHVAWDEEVYL